MKFRHFLAHPKRREERAKLLATFLSNLGAAAIIAGLIAPGFSAETKWSDAMFASAAGLIMHLAGQGILHYVVADIPELQA